ncbi:MAG: hypothetical protein N2235_08350 [Fischerella sp.]|nr:hypothetical protein [Fischerella sp.]
MSNIVNPLYTPRIHAGECVALRAFLLNRQHSLNKDWRVAKRAECKKQIQKVLDQFIEGFDSKQASKLDIYTTLQTGKNSYEL